MRALDKLGIKITDDAARETLHVHGCGGRIPAQSGDLYVANSGTTVRFLTALLTLGKGQFRLDGTPRMRERPIEDLLAGVESTRCQSNQRIGQWLPARYPQFRWFAWRSRDDSRQYLQPVSEWAIDGRAVRAQPVEIVVNGELVSQPYVHMTLAVMRSFGVAVDAGDLTRFVIPNARPYSGREYPIEPDASAASYFWAAAAIAGGNVTVAGLSRASLQGDVEFVDVLARMGCQVSDSPQGITVQAADRLRGVDVDMNAISDTVQTLGAVALFAEGPTTITGVAHIRHKETDRITALATELRKFGAEVDERPDGLRIEPAPLHAATIDTYDDHRMAMSMALVGLRIPGVVIRDPGCTAKTYPEFFRDLGRLQ